MGYYDGSRKGCTRWYLISFVRLLTHFAPVWRGGHDDIELQVKLSFFCFFFDTHTMSQCGLTVSCASFHHEFNNHAPSPPSSRRPSPEVHQSPILGIITADLASLNLKEWYKPIFHTFGFFERENTKRLCLQVTDIYQYELLFT